MSEALLLDLLNTTPVRDGTPEDDLADPDTGLRWLADHGQPGTEDEWRSLVEARDVLQGIVRGDRDPGEVARFVDGVFRRAYYDGGVRWSLGVPEGRETAAKAVLAWDELAREHPGRLRPCANPECRLFLIDHSRPNNARWCSMALCGNRMKARRHYRRTKG
ncbi:CGNR zinc finger domain-containing protein [Kibdelosporangium lantanae]